MVERMVWASAFIFDCSKSLNTAPYVTTTIITNYRCIRYFLT